MRDLEEMIYKYTNKPDHLCATIHAWQNIYRSKAFKTHRQDCRAS